jgi:hypothetical protein
LEYRAQEQSANTISHSIARQDTEYRAQEQSANTASHLIARQDPEYRTQEKERLTVAPNSRHYDMACRYVLDTGQYMFHQPCGYWNKPCKHGCGYMHLSSSSTGTTNKCCAKGHLYYNSTNCELDLLIKHDLREQSSFMIQVITTPDFSLNSSMYNNLLAMGGTKVCNCNETPDWTQRGPGSTCVTLNEHNHHYMKNAISADPSCGLAWFIFDDT